MSIGLIMIIIGVIGAIVFLVLLGTSWLRFAKKRKKLLEELEKL